MDGADETVASSLGENRTVAPELLAELASRFPSLLGWISINPNAPTAFKDAIPMGDHSWLSIERYMDSIQATREERLELAARFDSGPHPGGPPLGEVWAEIRGA